MSHKKSEKKSSWIHFPDWAYPITRSLLSAVREKDPYTYGHCRRVARDARLLALAAGLSGEEARVIEFASLFHDLGKMGIPDQILLKPGRLSEHEEAIMREHPSKSVEIIKPLLEIPFFSRTVPAIRHHHERIDGMGYPDGKIGDQIPLAARIIVIADTYDAMTTTRPYRKGFPPEVAYKELKIFARRQFDADLVKVFLQAHPTWDDYEKEITEEFVSALYRRAA